MKSIQSALVGLAVLALGACATQENSESSSSPSTKAEAGRSGGSQSDNPKATPPQTTGSTRIVTTALTNDGGIEGSIPDQVLSETLMTLEEVARKESSNVPLLITYMGLLRLYGQNPSLSQDVERRAGAAGSKSFWYFIEAAYGAIVRKDFAFADYLLGKATKNSNGVPIAKTVIQHATGVRLYFDGKPQAGIYEIKKAAQADPPFLPALLTIGFMSLKSGDYAGAEQMFERAASVAPSSLNVKLGLGVARRVRGKSEEAATLIGQIFKQKPEDRRVVWNYALALSEGDAAAQKKAVDVLGKYFQLPGSFPELDARANALMTKLQSAPAGDQPKAQGTAPAPAATPAK